MRSRLCQQEGASLVVVLMVITIFGLIVSGLLTEASASVRYTTNVTDYEEKVYAADAGVALGIQQLQQHTDFCPEAGSNQALQTVNLNGYDASVSCQTTSGSVDGALGYAVITRSTSANSLTVQGAAGSPKLINGPVYVTGGLGSGFPNVGVKITNGNLRQNSASGCTSSTPDGVTIATGYGYYCQSASPADVAPTVPTLPSTPRSSVTTGGCTYFYPGTYTTTAPSLTSSTNFFASGVYYFNGIGQWTVGHSSEDRDVFGGAPASFEGSPQFTMPACATDAAAIAAAGGNVPEVSGTGAQFIFGGNSSLLLSKNGQLEMFTRTTDGTSSTRTASLVAVPDDSASAWTGGGYTQSTDFATILDFDNGANKSMVIHGLVYAPEQNARLYATEDVDAAVLGGIVVWELELQSSASGSGLTVSAGDGTPDPRKIVVTATAPAVASATAGRQVVSTAVVEIANDAQYDLTTLVDTLATVTVHSWRTRGAIESL